MKQILLILLLTFAAGICRAQTEHMKFKGVPMEGTLQVFTNNLKAKGFIPKGIQDGISMLKGEFAGYKDCTIAAIADKSGMICKVSVIFPDMNKWDDLDNCYSNYKTMLTEKYGKPEKCEEYFNDYYDRDDSSKMMGVQMDKYKYYSLFKCEQGQIELQISHDSFSSCYVRLNYFDKANQEELRKQIMDDL